MRLKRIKQRGENNCADVEKGSAQNKKNIEVSLTNHTLFRLLRTFRLFQLSGLLKLLSDILL